jgi:hypothetical protein
VIRVLVFSLIVLAILAAISWPSPFRREWSSVATDFLRIPNP